MMPPSSNTHRGTLKNTVNKEEDKGIANKEQHQHEEDAAMGGTRPAVAVR